MPKKENFLLMTFLILKLINNAPSPEAKTMLNETIGDQQSTDYDYEYYDESHSENADALEIPVNTQPYFEQSQIKITASPKTDIIMHCDVKNIQMNNVVVWYKGNTIYANGQYMINQRVAYLRNNSILLKNIDINDAGNYYCEILPENIRQYIILEVIPSSPLTILCDGQDVLNQNVIYKEDETHICECESSTLTINQIKWFTNGQKAEEYFKVQQNALILSAVHANNSGVYECLDDTDADNPKHAIFNLVIYYRPKLMAPRPYINTELGMDAKLYCDYKSEPTAGVAWIKDKELLNYSGKHMINYLKGEQFNRTTLTIKNVRFMDLGEYTCQAENTLGITELRVHLILQPEPGEFQAIQIYGNRIIIDWLVRSVQPLLDTIFEYKLNGFNSISMKHMQQYYNGMWKITHDIVLPNGEWQARMKTKNVNGWSHLSQPFNFTIEYDNNPLTGMVSDLESAEYGITNATITSLNRSATFKPNYWYNLSNFYILISLFIIRRLM